MLLPETIEETIELVRRELRQVVPADPLEEQQRKDTERLLQWLEELQELKTDDTKALENALDALRRMLDVAELKEQVTQADKHHANRLRKLINNLEELIDLEKQRKAAEAPPPPKREAHKPQFQHANNNRNRGRKRRRH